ncbi:MAG: phosphoribosylformylglycinamidine synthase I [Candidatus Daviesbacteria bacterium]|nr:phosphoribosylformylglycinamidine synthase I [Candidatus Daviesbacteria bacterium]
MERPRVCVLKTDGINCDNELAYSFELAGGKPQHVHINELISKEARLSDYQILAIPGGFSYGDDIASGRVLANELTSRLRDEVHDFVETRQGLVLGICNGFQVLVRTGLLPYRKLINTLGDMDATLDFNNVGHFDCRWVNLAVEDSKCEFTKAMDKVVSIQVAHGEGNFYVQPETLKNIETQKLVAFRYCDVLGNPTLEYPLNPNGSINAIAGITDATGRILGLMPHPERFVLKTQHPNWRRKPSMKPQGLPLFEGIVSYAKGS